MPLKVTSVPPHYETLGVDPCISDRELAQHYKKLSLQFHPDRAAYRDHPKNEEDVQARYQRITEAYAVLSDPEKRSAYDTKHGVNFGSRLSRLQTVIGQHNTNALQRSVRTVTEGGRGGSDVPHPTSTEVPSSLRYCEEKLPDPSPGVAGVVDDDDEDYDPMETVVSVSETQHRGAAAQHVGSDGGKSEFRLLKRHFSLVPHVDISRDHLEDVNNADTRYDGFTLTRPIQNLASVSARSWGLAVEGRKVIGLHLEHERESNGIVGLGAVPFPSVLQQINDSMVASHADISRLLSQPSARQTALVSPETRVTISADVNKQMAVASPSPAAKFPANEPMSSEAVSATEDLHVVVAYTTFLYDLVGDVHHFLDAETLDRLVPLTSLAPQIPALWSDASVISVNGSRVRSAAELRAALRCAATAVSAGTDHDQATKRPRLSRSVVLEFCQLPLL